MERQHSYEYFLVTEVPHNNDYMIRLIEANEDLGTLQPTSSEDRSKVIPVPRAFIQGLTPFQVGELIVNQYKLEKHRDSRRKNLAEIDLYFRSNGASYSQLRLIHRELTRRSLTRYLEPNHK